MTAYYNEHDAFAARWLRQLILVGAIAPGDVDERDIQDVKPSELSGYTQCHFFAGIGGWSLALRLAGWPDDTPVWTGSCPCQPFSTAGRGNGVSDERHLWPSFRWLIDQCRPATVFGEQVASKLGRDWLSDLFSDLENLGYRAGGADLCAAGVGAPHIRQRLWWVADSCIKQRSQPPDSQCCEKDERSTNGGVADTLVNTVRLGSQTSNDVACRQQSVEHKPGLEPGVPMGITHSNGSQSGDRSTTTTRQRHPFITASDWSDHDIITCYDGKARFVEPGLAPLADGIPARVGRLRGYGNAIVPQVAAQFIKAYANG